jgi:alanine-synthesizing transaminase
MFSSRVPRSLEANALSRAVREARAAGRQLIDLTVTNPTRAGFDYPDALLRGLQSPDALRYEPEPFGLMAAREAVARDYARRGVAVAPDRVVLTSSTSEAYSLLFKLLCDPSGDRVLTPVPSYPLFEHLTRLDGVSTSAYALEYHGRWVLEMSSVEAAWTSRTRAVLAVSPNSPTGSRLHASEEYARAAACASRGAALIVDEVFADYPLNGAGFDAGHATHEQTDAGSSRPLTFRLGGLSKSAGLPQVKLGWIAIEGSERDVAAALDRLEFICDAYLSVSTPVQIAAPALIQDGAAVRRQIADRVRGNYARLRELSAGSPSIEVLAADAGWSAVLRVPARRSEEALVLDLLERDAVVAHPGFFFDFPREAFLVVSLLPEPALFEEGIMRILDRAA